MPGKNDTGTNTEISTSEVATTALATSAMAAEVAVCGSVLSSLMCRWAFSMTTIASSTTNPVARVMPNSVSELMEKSKILMKANVPISETGIVTAGMMVARQSSRNRKITMITMRIGFFQRGYHFLYRIADDRRGIESDDILDAGRKGLRQFRQSGLRRSCPPPTR